MMKKAFISLLIKILKEKMTLIRVSTNKQKKDLENQINLLKNHCFTNGIKINGIFTDIASGISFEKKRKFLFDVKRYFRRKSKQSYNYI